MPTPEIYEKNWPSKSSFLTISLHKCPLLTSPIDPAWSIHPPMLVLYFFWLFKNRFKAIFNFLTNFWPSKSSIFRVYNHSWDFWRQKQRWYGGSAVSFQFSNLIRRIRRINESMIRRIRRFFYYSVSFIIPSRVAHSPYFQAGFFCPVARFDCPLRR